MSKSLLFQIVKQILVNLVVHLFYERRFLVNGTSSPPWYTTSFWYVIHYHVLHLPCKGSCVSQGGQLRIRKILKLYIVLYRNTMKNIKISLNKIWYTYTALIPKNMMLSHTPRYFSFASLLNKCKFWFKCVSWTNDQNTGEGCTVYR